ncbi:MAG: hypothetical protein JO189_20715, partial [Deltaproteobacteria bacterium]|nr:hypothetical protein [Deltaproteobacteria bacterium]
LASRFVGIDAKVHCQGVTAWLLYQLGYPGQAMTTAKQLLAWARQLSHPYSLIFAEYIFSSIHRERQRDPYVAQEQAERGIALCDEYGVRDFAALMTIDRGWAIAHQGHGDEGVTQIRDALEILRARENGVERPLGLYLLGQACGASGKFDEGLTALIEALILIEAQENRRDEAMLLWLKGELLWQAADAIEARQYFESAIQVARGRGAKSFELRATTSLARLLASQGCCDEARTMLAEIYNWFTEGFDTVDLKEAKALIDELNW